MCKHWIFDESIELIANRVQAVDGFSVCGFLQKFYAIGIFEAAFVPQHGVFGVPQRPFKLNTSKF